jgi:Tol biopolymer transport system component
MSRVDDHIRERLQTLVDPSETDALFERLSNRKRRRALVRKVQTGALVGVVLAGTVASFLFLADAFRPSREPAGTPIPPVLPGNGVIVFSRELDDGSVALFSINPDGTGERRLTPEGAATYRDPTISPDGRTIAFVHTIPSFGNGESVIATIPIEGGPPVWLTDPGVYADPAWAPDGSKIAFAGSPGGPDGIYLMKADGTDPELIPGTDEIAVAQPTWSPDGTMVAFAVSKPLELSDIWIAAIDGSGLRNFTNTRDASEGSPDWSWATDRIVFIRGAIDSTWLVLASPGGSQETLDSLIGRLNDNQYAPSWSPDGRAIAFEDRPLGTDERNVWIVGADGSDPTRLTLNGGFDPAWQPIPAATGVSPSPSPTETLPADEGRDIGLSFRLCRVETLGGIDLLGDGTAGRAWTGVPAKDDGTCPEFPRPGAYALAVDHTGDGLADSWIDLPFECYTFCSPHDATDLDGNGTEELIVSDHFSIQDFRFFTLRSDEGGALQVEPILAAEPGHDPAGITAGEPLRINAGGDAGYASTIRCEGDPSAPVIVWSWVFGPIETDIPKEVHITQIQLRSDGLFHVIGTNDYTIPATEPGNIGTQFEIDPECGVHWSP